MAARFGITAAVSALIVSIFLMSVYILPAESFALDGDLTIQKQVAAIPFDEKYEQVSGMTMGQSPHTPFNPEIAAVQLRRIKRQSCSIGQTACDWSCRWQDCEPGYCYKGTCRCGRCD